MENHITLIMFTVACGLIILILFLMFHDAYPHLFWTPEEKFQFDTLTGQTWTEVTVNTFESKDFILENPYFINTLRGPFCKFVLTNKHDSSRREETIGTLPLAVFTKKLQKKKI